MGTTKDPLLSFNLLTILKWIMLHAQASLKAVHVFIVLDQLIHEKSGIYTIANWLVRL